MYVAAAFAAVILIWSTTPLAMKWSGEDVGFLFGISARIVLGAGVCLVLLRALQIAFPWDRTARRVYVASGLGIYGAMLSSYWAAQRIPSGWIALIFALAPVVTGILAARWLGERAFTAAKSAGLLLSLAGVVVIFRTGLRLDPGAAYGILAVLGAVCMHSAGGVWVKRIGAGVPALAVATGGLLVSAPLFVVTLALSGPIWPEVIPVRAAGAILYLAVIGSAVGFVLYYALLKRVAAGKVALVTLVTPVLALVLGNRLAGEPIGPDVWLGAACVMSGLACHQWGGRLPGAFARAYTLARPARSKTLETEEAS